MDPVRTGVVRIPYHLSPETQQHAIAPGGLPERDGSWVLRVLSPIAISFWNVLAIRDAETVRAFQNETRLAPPSEILIGGFSDIFSTAVKGWLGRLGRAYR
jgi:hypothetical protein